MLRYLYTYLKALRLEICKNLSDAKNMKTILNLIATGNIDALWEGKTTKELLIVIGAKILIFHFMQFQA